MPHTSEVRGIQYCLGVSVIVTTTLQRVRHINVDIHQIVQIPVDIVQRIQQTQLMEIRF